MPAIIVWIKQIVIFGIISNLIIHLLPNGNYTKYVKLFTGLIMIMITINPLTQLLNLDISLNQLYASYNEMQNQSDLQAQLKYAQESNYDKIIEPYREEIVAKVETIVMDNNLYPANVEVVIDTETDSTTFGQIAMINLKVSKKYDDEKKIVIDKIKVEGSKTGINGGDTQSLSVNEINIINAICNFYNIDESNINISMQG